MIILRRLKTKCLRLARPYTLAMVTVTGSVLSVIPAILVGTILINPLFTSTAQAKAVQSGATQSGYSTYVIETYGGSALIAAVQQQLSDVDGGSVSEYQGKLVVRTTPAGYQAVQQLLGQIDYAPKPLKVSVRVGTTAQSSGSIEQGRVIISSGNGSRDDRHKVRVEGYGGFSNQNNQQQSNSIYQVNTLSGYSASIGTSTLLSLAQRYLGAIYSNNLNPANSYNPYPRPIRPTRHIGVVRINQQVLVDTNRGIAVTPTLLPNNTVQVSIKQIEDRVTGDSQRPIQSQQLATTLIVPRGQWVSIGEVSQLQQQFSNGNYFGGGSHALNSSVNIPIQIKVE